MAQMFPNQILGDDVPASERRVFDALSGLGDDWLVFHSVAWQGQRGPRQNDGEADFVIAHPNKGAVIIEVKGGGIALNDGQWTSQDRRGRVHTIHNPFEQVRDSKHVLGGFLAERIPRVGRKVHMGHAVALPDLEIDGDLSAEAQREVILDRYDLRDIERSINRIASHWNDSSTFDREQFSALQKALAPTRRVRRLLRHEVEDRVEDLIELTDQQVRALGFLRRQRRALITGGAGTGKTVLAAERAQQLAADGLRVLFLCFNAPLGGKLAEDLAGVEGITAGNFHKVARQFVADAGLLPADGYDDQTFWADVLPSLLPDAAQKLDVAFDAILVDEGQDFHANWWTALELLLTDPDNGFFYVFADDNQNVYRANWERPFDGEPFLLDINCRNTNPIAARVGAVFDRDEPSLGVDGPDPAFIEVADLRQAPKRLAGILEKLLGVEGIKPDQVAILTDDRKLVDGLRGQQLGGHRLVEYGKRGITVETVHRFKGLESDAVLLVLGDIGSPDGLKLAYVGMSRARVILFVLGKGETKKALSWP